MKPEKPHHNRKVAREDIIRLNALGISLARMAKILECHPTTITLRLQSLGIPAADTRYSFMEKIYDRLSEDQREWLSDLLLKNDLSVNEYVFRLITREHQINP